MTMADMRGSVRATPEQWFAKSAGRPAWECWGKAQSAGTCPAHPLLCHMLDVAAVAERLLTTHAPRATRRRLLALSPLGEESSLRFLLSLIALHDLGKLTPGFQSKVEWAQRCLQGVGYDFPGAFKARQHGATGFVFITEALERLGAPTDAGVRLARSVAAHHGEFPGDSLLTRERMGRRERGEGRWELARHETVGALGELFAPVDAARVSPVDHAFVVELAGLTSVADWIGSMDHVFAYEHAAGGAEQYWPVAQERATEALERAGLRPHVPRVQRPFEQLFPGYTPWPLHEAAEAAARDMGEPSLFIIEAPMGEGKTEAALLLADTASSRLGLEGMYIGLPTRATANQMFGRVRRFLDRTSSGPVVLSLTHGEASSVDGFRSLLAIHDDDGLPDGVRAESWFLSAKRALLAEHGVGTIDQALMGVLRTKHGFVRLHGLAGKTVILDEVHAYDTFTGTLLDELLEWLAALGATVILLSATLPARRRNELSGAFQRGLAVHSAPADGAPYPRITTVTSNRVAAHHVEPRGAGHTVTLERVDPAPPQIAGALARAVAAGGCAGWICNTVARAQEACEALDRIAPDVPRLLLHARMLPDDRARREQLLEQWLGPERGGTTRPDRLVVIGTQVLEQSLDVDFDVLVSDLAPVDLLLQRAGRLHRHQARTNRSAAHSEAMLWLAHASGSPEDIPIRDIAVIYAEWLVRQTLRVLHGRRTLRLPADIEPLVEAVYGAAPPPADDALFGAYLDHFGGSVALRQNAQQRVIPRPVSADDIFAALTMPFGDDDDPAVRDELKAITRDGRPSAQLVCLAGRKDGVYMSDEDEVQLDLESVPSASLCDRLAKRTITVTDPVLVRTLHTDPARRPAAWSRSALLRHRRAVVFTDGTATVGGRQLTLHPELGLRIQTSGRPTP
jgi:CRISPR-associated endonuclease/helicase Cas3